MTRLAIGAAFSLLVATTSLARAQSEQPTDIGTAARCSREVNGCTEHPELLDAVKAAADQANVSPTDLLGAVNTTHMDPVAYLCAADGLLCPVAVTPAPACDWPICGPLGRRLFCVEKIESNHGAAMYNRTPVWNGEHAQGWLGFLPSTARSVGVTIGNRWSEWAGAARMLATGRGREFYGVAAGIC